MTATDELRRMLDERGVEWDADDEIMDDGSISQVTYWYSNGIEWSADGRDEYLAFDAVQLITPAQAIAATLGSSNCTNSERMTEQNGPERSGEYVTVWMDHEPTKLHWGVPVVRCRDCEYYRDHEWMMVTDVVDVCHFFADGVKVEPDGFCAWGRLKEEQWASPSSRTQ